VLDWYQNLGRRGDAAGRLDLLRRPAGDAGGRRPTPHRRHGNESAWQLRRTARQSERRGVDAARPRRTRCGAARGCGVAGPPTVRGVPPGHATAARGGTAQSRGRGVHAWMQHVGAPCGHGRSECRSGGARGVPRATGLTDGMGAWRPATPMRRRPWRRAHPVATVRHVSGATPPSAGGRQHRMAACRAAAARAGHDRTDAPAQCGHTAPAPRPKHKYQSVARCRAWRPLPIPPSSVSVDTFAAAADVGLTLDAQAPDASATGAETSRCLRRPWWPPCRRLAACRP